MRSKQEKILVWLPSPLGDAVLCTPALRALRELYRSKHITFLARQTVREILEPCPFNDEWKCITERNPLSIAAALRGGRFSQAVLFKNSFGSALATFLAGIHNRIGYAREGRSIFLTGKLYPLRNYNSFRPVPMVDYYLKIAGSLGASGTSKELELSVNEKDIENVRSKLPQLKDSSGPLVIMVPGSAFGPSKFWLPERFAATADRLYDNFNARVIISVSNNAVERQLAEQICSVSRSDVINLGREVISLGELKALFSMAELVITTDTGPRHIAKAFNDKIVSLFGPNEPAWTDTEYSDEIKIVGQAQCAPCQRPKCRQGEHLCMEAISTAQVYEAARQLLENHS